MKLGRSFNSVTKWVVLAHKILIWGQIDSHFSCCGILMYFTKLSILGFAENLPATSRHSEIYTSDGFASFGSSRHQRQTTKWRTYDGADHFLFVLIKNTSQSHVVVINIAIILILSCCMCSSYKSYQWFICEHNHLLTAIATIVS